MAQHRKGGNDDEAPRNASLFQFDPDGKKTDKTPVMGNSDSKGGTGGGPGGPKVYEVWELTVFLKKLVEANPVLNDAWVKGEVSGFKVAGSGHAYFALKDEKAIINCVMWSSLLRSLKFELKDGLKLVVRGDVSIYESRGTYNLILKEVRPEGIGALYLAFEQLKKKLQSEGLFDDTLKRPLPRLPSVVGVVTSPTGAVIQDIRNILFGRFPNAHLLVAPARVQGEGAAKDIVDAIALLNSLKDGRPDVIIVARGGGSLEDLWAFNEETVARAIRASAIPVVSAVGHETDFTIADFVADRRAPTPSKAAEMVMPDRKEMEERIRMLTQGLKRELAGRFDQSRIRLDELSRALGLAVLNLVQGRREKTLRLAQVLDAMSPMQVLGRGYSITIRQATGTAVRDPGELEEGEGLRTLLARGDVLSSVISINRRGEEPCPPKVRGKKGRKK
jgi:exodeoxyribonuclease VII large subunit